MACSETIPLRVSVTPQWPYGQPVAVPATLHEQWILLAKILDPPLVGKVQGALEFLANFLNNNFRYSEN